MTWNAHFAFCLPSSSLALLPSQLVSVPVGQASEVVLRVPGGTRVEWRWGVASHDIAFSVDACAGPESAAPEGTLNITSSLRGVHALAAGYTGPLAHFLDPEAPQPPVPSLRPSGAIAGAAALPWLSVAQASKSASGAGSWSAPTSVTHSLVRLTWDNGYSWLLGKTVSRRVDVVLAGDDPEAVPIEADPAADIAAARAANTEQFGRVGAPDPPGCVMALFRVAECKSES